MPLGGALPCHVVNIKLSKPPGNIDKMPSDVFFFLATFIVTLVAIPVHHGISLNRRDVTHSTQRTQLMRLSRKMGITVVTMQRAIVGQSATNLRVLR